MAKPKLIINGHDYTEYITSMEPTVNALDADGSGRDVQTGQMFRTIVARKQSWKIGLAPIPESVMQNLISDTSPEYYTATILNPANGAQASITAYTSAMPCGGMRYAPSRNALEYVGVSFNMVER